MNNLVSCKSLKWRTCLNLSTLILSFLTLKKCHFFISSFYENLLEIFKFLIIFFLVPKKKKLFSLLEVFFFRYFHFDWYVFFIVFHFINSRDWILNYFCLVEIVTKIIILANWSFYNFIFSIWKDVFDQLTATTEMNILSWQLNRIIEMFQLSKLFYYSQKLKGVLADVEKVSMVIATNLTSICCVYKEKISKKNDSLRRT